jgi:hypothetical protein
LGKVHYDNGSKANIQAKQHHQVQQHNLDHMYLKYALNQSIEDVYELIVTQVVHSPNLIYLDV